VPLYVLAREETIRAWQPLSKMRCESRGTKLRSCNGSPTVPPWESRVPDVGHVLGLSDACEDIEDLIRAHLPIPDRRWMPSEAISRKGEASDARDRRATHVEWTRRVLGLLAAAFCLIAAFSKSTICKSLTSCGLWQRVRQGDISRAVTEFCTRLNSQRSRRIRRSRGDLLETRLRAVMRFRELYATVSRCLTSTSTVSEQDSSLRSD
jgi:hypothetical protein